MQPRATLQATLRWGWPLPAAMLFAPARGFAATGAHAAPASPSVVWAIPFAGLLLSVALGPMLAPRRWHRWSRTVTLGWSVALLLAEAAVGGPAVAAASLRDAMLLEYLPFITLLIALYAAAGGVVVAGGPWGEPAGNTALLGVGTLLGGLVGTTAAAMTLIHPFLRANAHRSRKVHLVIFFIVLVGNAGGALSPIGNPPLLVGFLEGVPFLWPLRWLTWPLLVLSAPLLLGFYLLDRHLARGESPARRREPLRVRGAGNLGLIGLVAASETALGAWRGGSVWLFGTGVPAGRLAETLVCVAVSLVSVAMTPAGHRRRNAFSWAPMVEVAELFAAIFITIGPVMAMLQAGAGGPLGPLFSLVTNQAGEPLPAAYFWLSGICSAFLDNAPTYLVFFGLAGNDAALLSGPLARTLVAISAGSVFFGGLTYIGSAPNLMVRSIAAHRGVRMPGFFGYSVIAALVLAGPLLLVTWAVR